MKNKEMSQPKEFEARLYELNHGDGYADRSSSLGILGVKEINHRRFETILQGRCSLAEPLYTKQDLSKAIEENSTTEHCGCWN